MSVFLWVVEDGGGLVLVLVVEVEVPVVVVVAQPPANRPRLHAAHWDHGNGIMLIFYGCLSNGEGWQDLSVTSES